MERIIEMDAAEFAERLGVAGEVVGVNRRVKAGKVLVRDRERPAPRPAADGGPPAGERVKWREWL